MHSEFWLENLNGRDHRWVDKIKLDIVGWGSEHRAVWPQSGEPVASCCKHGSIKCGEFLD
jgi:hypothetical protein